MHETTTASVLAARFAVCVGGRCVALCGLLAAAAYAAPPQITHLYPAGGQRGTSVVVDLGGTVGDAPVEVWSDRPDIRATVDTARKQATLSIAADAVPGVRWLRFYNAQGASPLRPFVIGQHPEFQEQEPNNAPPSAQRIEAPVAVVNGVLASSGDVDVYAVALRAGQTLVASLQANQQLGSPMDAVLQVLCPEQFVRDQNDDDSGLDPQLFYTAAHDGLHYLRVFAFPAMPDATVRFAGGPNFVYRLTLTTGPFVHHALPLAVARSTPQPVKVVGWNLPAELQTLAPLLPPAASAGEGENPSASAGDANQDSPWAPWAQHAVLSHPQLALPLQLPLLEHPSIVEADLNDRQHPQAIRPPVTVTGTIGTAGEVDVFAFPAAKGEVLLLEVESRALGYPLDPVLRIVGPDGKQLAEVDDAPRGSADVKHSFTVPADGTYRVEIADLYGNGGLRFAYRLTVRHPQPGFALQLTGDAFVVQADKPLEIAVAVERQSLSEEIEIAILGLPEHIVCPSVRSLPGGESARSVKLQLMATRPAAFSGPVQIVGRTRGTKRMQRFAQAPAGQYLPATHHLWLTTIGP
jgi:hypothetical protein